MRKTLSLLTLSIAIYLYSGYLMAGWGIGQDIIDVARGKKPVEVTHNGKKYVELGTDSAYVDLGVARFKTHQLQKRLKQAGCLYATGGDVMQCAPDVLYREANRLVTEYAPNYLSNPNLQVRQVINNPSLYNMGMPQITPMSTSVGPAWSPPGSFRPAIACVTSIGTCMITYNFTGAGVGSPCNCSGVLGITQ